MCTTSANTSFSPSSYATSECVNSNIQVIESGEPTREADASTVLASSSGLGLQSHEGEPDTRITLEDEEDLKVTFFPPLHAARSSWILDHLRRERVSSVRYAFF